MSIETHLLASALRSRESSNLIKVHLDPAAKNKKDVRYSPEFRILTKKIEEYYSRDSDAQHVEQALIIGLIESTVSNDKHKDRFKQLIEEAFAVDTSVSNTNDMILQAKRSEVGDKLAVKLVNREEVDEELAEYNHLHGLVSLDQWLTQDTNVLTGADARGVLSYLSTQQGTFKLRPSRLSEAVEEGLMEGHAIVVQARPEIGKCLAIGTKILMADGTARNVEEVKAGELVAGVSGPRTVLSTTAGEATMYKITYPWGDSYTVNDEHVLSLKRSKVEGSHNYGDILNVPVKEYMEWPDGRKQRYKGWKAGQEYGHNDLLMDPYLLGVWLGDGSSTKPAITTTNSEILEEFVKEYGEPSKVEKGITYAWGRTKLFPHLKQLGVLNDKHIPHCYLTASRGQRLELLAGIVDSDGYRLQRNAGYQIITKSEKLKEGYLALARGLGFHATAKVVYKRSQESELKPYWDVYVGAEAYEELPVRLAYKKGQQSAEPKRKGLQFGIKVEEVGLGKYAGFSLDGDHLFLLADYTVTHNSAFAITNACGWAMDGKRVLYFINEDPEKLIQLRCISCLSGMTKLEMYENPDKALALAERRGLNNLTIVPIYPGNLSEIEAFIEKYEPHAIVVDQLRNLKVKSENRTGQLEAAAQGIRDLGKKYNLVTLSFTQAGESAEGKAILDMSDTDSSKTGIASACDLLIGIGATEEHKAGNIRVFSLSKNKVSGWHGSFPARINPFLSRYSNVE